MWSCGEMNGIPCTISPYGGLRKSLTAKYLIYRKAGHILTKEARSTGNTFQSVLTTRAMWYGKATLRICMTAPLRMAVRSLSPAVREIPA